jgi:hypothetical protein
LHSVLGWAFAKRYAHPRAQGWPKGHPSPAELHMTEVSCMVAVTHASEGRILSTQHRVPTQFRRFILGILALTGMILVSRPDDASAVPISGDFSGIATNSRLRISERETIDFDGETVTGSLTIEPDRITPYIPFSISPDGTTAYFYHSESEPTSYERLSIVAHGAHLTFTRGGGSTLTLYSDSNSQRVHFGIGALYPYYNASLWLEGPPGTLFDDFDPRTLRVDANTEVTSVSFFADRGFGAAVRDVEVRFEGVNYAVEVPEPGALALLTVGLAGLAGLTARSRKKDFSGKIGQDPEARATRQGGLISDCKIPRSSIGRFLQRS